LLVAAALTASFFGAAAVGHDGIVAPVVLAAVALAVTVLSGLYVLYPTNWTRACFYPAKDGVSSFRLEPREASLFEP
jgi:hypothetical protein